MPSTVGQGANGLVSNKRSFGELQLDTLAATDSFFEWVMGKAITKTGTHSGSIYYTDVAVSALTWAGRIRPVVGLEVMKVPRALTRVQQLTDIVAGKWYANDSAVVPGGTLRVYYQLPDSSDPTTTELVLHLLFCAATTFGSHPQFDDPFETDAVFNWWDSSTVPTYWTPSGVAASGVAVTRSTTLMPGIRSQFSLRIDPGASGLPNNTNGGVLISGKSIEAGRQYWCIVDYLTDAVIPAGVTAALRVLAGGGQFMLADGVNFTASPNVLSLTSTGGRPKHALFVFTAPSSSTVAAFHARLHNASGGTVTAGGCNFFRFRILPVFRTLAFDELLAADAVPSISVGSASIAFGEKTLGGGSVKLQDPKGDLARAFGSLLPTGKPAYLYTGTSTRSLQLTRDDWRPTFRGLTDKVTQDALAGTITLALTDTRSLAYAQAAANALRVPDLSKLNVKDGGTVKALLFGETAEAVFPGARVDLDSNAYGSYQILDDTVPVRDNVDVSLPAGYTVKVYPNEELAKKDEAGYDLALTITGNTLANPTVVTTSTRHGLTTGDAVTISGSNSTPNIDGRRTVTVITETTFSVAVNVTVAGTTGKVFSHADIDYSNNNTRWIVKRDIRNFGRDKSGAPIGVNFTISFLYGAATVTTAPINISGPGWKVAQDVQAAMRLAAGAVTTILVTYSESTHLFTITRTGGGGALSLFTHGGGAAATAATGAKQVYKAILGYNTDADHVGATTYVAENAMFEDADRDHIIRWPGGGYRDPDGSICGVAGIINNWPSVISWLLMKVLNIPPARVDVPSVANARNQSLSGDLAEILLYVREPGNVLELLALADQVALCDTVIAADGVISVRRHSDSAPVYQSFSDDDYLSFVVVQDRTRLFKDVKVWGGYDPGLDRYTTWGDGVGVADPAFEIKYGVTATYSLDAGLTTSVINGGTQVVGNALQRLFKNAPITVELEVLGKALDLLIGDRIQLTCARVMTASGALDATNFRVLDVSNDNVTKRGKVVAVQDVQIHS